MEKMVGSSFLTPVYIYTFLYIYIWDPIEKRLKRKLEHFYIILSIWISKDGYTVYNNSSLSNILFIKILAKKAL